GEQPKIYYGNVSDYLEKKRADLDATGKAASSRATLPGGPARSGKSGASKTTAGGADSGANRKEQRRLEAKAREARAAKLKPLKTEFTALEAEIAALETEKGELTAKLADPAFFAQGDPAAVAMKRFAELESILETRYSK